MESCSILEDDGSLKKYYELKSAVKDQFGSIEKFKEDFCNAGATQFGSGWCWLVKENDGTLKITKTENGVNPICFNQKHYLVVMFGSILII